MQRLFKFTCQLQKPRHEEIFNFDSFNSCSIELQEESK